MKSSGGRSAAKMERKMVEKNRRMHMKGLCFKLSSLIPREHITSSKDALTQQDYLDLAASYIKSLRERIEKLKQRRELRTSTDVGISKGISNGMAKDMRLPVIEVRHQESNLEVVLISGLNRSFTFHEVISILEEEGAEVVNASFSIVGDKIFHTIHSQAVSSRIGLEASRVSERLEELVQQAILDPQEAGTLETRVKNKFNIVDNSGY